MMITILAASLLLILVYTLIFRKYRKIWAKDLSSDLPDDQDPEFYLSVIIPFRNEESHLPSLVKGLSKLEYDPQRVEYLFVDDHSTDHSAEFLDARLSRIPNACMISLAENRRGKKEALREGVSRAKGTLILTTDADCIPPPGWLKEMAGIYRIKKPVLISGPVRIYPVQTFFERFQALEFSALTGTGGASFLTGSPLMCNGANLAFQKDFFQEAYPFIHPGVPSGDDMFLMLYAKEKYPDRLVFLPHPAAIVNTAPVKNLRAFLGQRARWTSKSWLYRDAHLVFLSLFIFLVNAWVFFLAGAGFANSMNWWILAFYLLLKSANDYLFLKAVCLFYKQSELLKIFIPSQLIYSFYVVSVALIGTFSRKNAKGA